MGIRDNLWVSTCLDGWEQRNRLCVQFSEPEPGRPGPGTLGSRRGEKEVVERTSYGAVSKCNLGARKLLTRRRGDGKKADPATRCVARRRDLDRNGSGLLQLRNRSSRVRSRCGPLGPAGGALVIRPQVLLLDEPLSALDLRLRQQLRREVREIQQELGITTIFVTHDQVEALSMSDRVAVMNGGRVVQVGTPSEIYTRPRTEFVAAFLGETSLLTGNVVRLSASKAWIRTDAGLQVAVEQTEASMWAGDKVVLMIRPDALRIEPSRGQLSEGAVEGTVYLTSFLSSLVRYHITLDEGVRVFADLSLATAPSDSSPESVWSCRVRGRVCSAFARTWAQVLGGSMVGPRERRAHARDEVATEGRRAWGIRGSLTRSSSGLVTTGSCAGPIWCGGAFAPSSSSAVRSSEERA